MLQAITLIPCYTMILSLKLIEVKCRMYDCSDRLVGDIDEMSKIGEQIESFKSKVRFFGSPIAQRTLKTKTPSQWWESYGDEYPELQRFAIRILSLTYSSSGCESNWSTFERVRLLIYDMNLIL